MPPCSEMQVLYAAWYFPLMLNILIPPFRYYVIKANTMPKYNALITKDNNVDLFQDKCHSVSFGNRTRKKLIKQRGINRRVKDGDIVSDRHSNVSVCI